MNKPLAFEKAVEITKEYARGGGTNPQAVLESLYNKLKELSQDVSEEN